MQSDTCMGGGDRRFHSTLWTVVLRAKEDSREALELLLAAYWKPLYGYLRRKGTPSEDAKDLVQGFFADLLSRDWLRSVEPERGKFRTFLLTALDRYRINQAERARAQKRGGGKTPLALDFSDAEAAFVAEPATTETPERAFFRAWAVVVLERALLALEQETEPGIYEALKPHLAGGPPYEETAGRLGMPVSQLNNRIHRFRRRYRDLIREEVASSVADASGIEDEMNDLFEVLGG